MFKTKQIKKLTCKLKTFLLSEYGRVLLTCLQKCRLLLASDSPERKVFLFSLPLFILCFVLQKLFTNLGSQDLGHFFFFFPVMILQIDLYDWTLCL